MADTVLLVEDDEGIAVPLVRTLEREGYAVVHVDAGVPALRRAAEGDVALVILDLGLPDLDGLEVCRRLRENGFGGGILILTARGGELDRVVGLDVGADDYLAKPFALAELLARTRAVLRRTAPPTPVSEAAGPTDKATLRIDVDARRAWAGSEEIALTSKEFDVLALLAKHPGAVVTRERLMAEVWDENWFGSTKTLDVTIGRLRQKIEGHDSPSRIVTVRGVGFRLEDGSGDA